MDLNLEGKGRELSQSNINEMEACLSLHQKAMEAHAASMDQHQKACDKLAAMIQRVKAKYAGAAADAQITIIR